MAIPYEQALALVCHAAELQKGSKFPFETIISLPDALGRRPCQDVRAQIDTPIFASSAMDGYAVSSILTAKASFTNPHYLRVEGMIAAGDPYLKLPCDVNELGTIACVKIMTGAPFPQSSNGLEFDACIPVEHAELIDDERIVRIVTPPKPNHHRRIAGDDFAVGDMIVPGGVEIRPHHIMAMASVGIRSLRVKERLKATVLTTGAELKKVAPGLLISDLRPSQIDDCNGPYLQAALQSIGVDVTCISGIADDLGELQNCIADIISSGCDMLITTGGVSAGDFDFIPQAIINIDGHVHFHHVAMRPGHPVLFATAPKRSDEGLSRDIPIFGLPGNPIAAATCYRFLVVPYIESLMGTRREQPIVSVAADGGDKDPSPKAGRSGNSVHQKSKHVDVFRHGLVWARDAVNEVVLSSEQSPAKVRPFGYANCWVHISTGVSEVKVGDRVDCYPF